MLGTGVAISGGLNSVADSIEQSNVADSESYRVFVQDGVIYKYDTTFGTVWKKEDTPGTKWKEVVDGFKE